MNLPREPKEAQATWAEENKTLEVMDTHKFALHDLKINLNRIELDESGSLTVKKEFLDKLPTPMTSGYDSDETVLYFPIIQKTCLKN